MAATCRMVAGSLRTWLRNGSALLNTRFIPAMSAPTVARTGSSLCAPSLRSWSLYTSAMPLGRTTCGKGGARVHMLTCVNAGHNQGSAPRPANADAGQGRRAGPMSSLVGGRPPANPATKSSRRMWSRNQSRAARPSGVAAPMVVVTHSRAQPANTHVHATLYSGRLASWWPMQAGTQPGCWLPRRMGAPGCDNLARTRCSRAHQASRISPPVCSMRPSTGNWVIAAPSARIHSVGVVMPLIALLSGPPPQVSSTRRCPYSRCSGVSGRTHIFRAWV